jgi:1,4-alpha-glucan branching enzyme
LTWHGRDEILAPAWAITLPHEETMVTTFHVLTGRDLAKLRIWRDHSANGASHQAYDVDAKGRDANGLQTFVDLLDAQLHEPAHALLHDGEWWESDAHRKDLPRGINYVFPAHLWCAEGANRVLTADPFGAAEPQLRIHLVTGDRYLEGKLLLWSPAGQHLVEAAAKEASGVVFDVALDGQQQHLFLFKFLDTDGKCESDLANRLWSARDGGEIWVMPDSPAIHARQPEQRKLFVNFQQFGEPTMPVLHLWQPSVLTQADIHGTRQGDGWVRFECPLYSEFMYQFMFFNPDRAEAVWESSEATRNVYLDAAGMAWTVAGNGTNRPLGSDQLWTIAGDHELFGAAPTASKTVLLELVARDPRSPLAGPLLLDVWINQGNAEMHHGIDADANGRWQFATYPEVVTSFRFRDAATTERIPRHFIKVSSDDADPLLRFVVSERADPLPRCPVTDQAELFADPPFAIERPGAWIADGCVRFALHCPTAACVEVVGEWTQWQAQPLAMRSTLDGAYWWAQVAVADITAALGRPSVHGTLYKFLINQTLLAQDPAADWVENSDPERASKLVDHARFVWQNNDWRRPGWEYLTVYQLHPARFAQRGGSVGLDGISRELADPDGYLRQVNATALLIMPTCEFAGDMGWGYNPSFFYSVESAYGGPEALKRLVDTCHARGIAVLLDVVFNHAGTSDNVLWRVARNSYFDGDTEWGAMINFDHPQVLHFFEQNIAHFMRHYRIDGFRFDFTRVIRFGDQWIPFVRTPGSGGGWEFLRRLQATARGIDPACLFMAENLPNDWDLTRPDGVMDTQWNDNFHDRLVDAAQGWQVMGSLGEALLATQADGARWFESTNYPESHDEVGNEDHRIAHLGGPGQGYRRNKVAAAATLFSRGIPMWFMGAESGEWRQFSKDGNATLDLAFYEQDDGARQLRHWWNRLAVLRRGNPRIQGPAPIRVRYAQDRTLALSRGDGDDLFVILNFGAGSGWRPLDELNLPEGSYKELLNSSWGDYRVASEGEVEHSNGGWDAQLNRGNWLNVPPYGVVVLEKR